MSTVELDIFRDKEEERKRKLISAFLTLLITAGIVALMLWMGMYYPDPPPPEEGIMVALGNPDAGNNDDPPEYAQQQQPQEASAPKSDESLETQDIEDAPELASADKKENKTPTENTEKTKPKEERKSDPNLEFKGKDNKNSNSGKGVKPGPGGALDGDPMGDPLAHGAGLSGDGDFYLNGRKKEKKVSADCKFSSDEIVVLKIKVDRNGYVSEASCVAKYQSFNATTLGDPYCSCAKNAVKNAGKLFTSKSDAPELQEGYIKFDFRVK